MVATTSKILLVLQLIFLLLKIVPNNASAGFDCKGKNFYCANTTHFLICVNFGNSISSTFDDFILPCPEGTECWQSNDSVCETPVVTPNAQQVSVTSSKSFKNVPTVPLSVLTTTPSNIVSTSAPVTGILTTVSEATTNGFQNKNSIYSELNEKTTVAEKITTTIPVQVSVRTETSKDVEILSNFESTTHILSDTINPNKFLLNDNLTNNINRLEISTVSTPSFKSTDVTNDVLGDTIYDTNFNKVSIDTSRTTEGFKLLVTKTLKDSDGSTLYNPILPGRLLERDKQNNNSVSDNRLLQQNVNNVTTILSKLEHNFEESTTNTLSAQNNNHMNYEETTMSSSVASSNSVSVKLQKGNVQDITTYLIASDAFDAVINNDNVGQKPSVNISSNDSNSAFLSTTETITDNPLPTAVINKALKKDVIKEAHTSIAESLDTVTKLTEIPLFLQSKSTVPPNNVWSTESYPNTVTYESKKVREANFTTINSTISPFQKENISSATYDTADQKIQIVKIEKVISKSLDFETKNGEKEISLSNTQNNKTTPLKVFQNMKTIISTETSNNNITSKASFVSTTEITEETQPITLLRTTNQEILNEKPETSTLDESYFDLQINKTISDTEHDLKKLLLIEHSTINNSLTDIIEITYVTNVFNNQSSIKFTNNETTSQLPNHQENYNKKAGLVVSVPNHLNSTLLINHEIDSQYQETGSDLVDITYAAPTHVTNISFESENKTQENVEVSIDTNTNLTESRYISIVPQLNRKVNVTSSDQNINKAIDETKTNLTTEHKHFDMVSASENPKATFPLTVNSVNDSNNTRTPHKGNSNDLLVTTTTNHSYNNLKASSNATVKNINTQIGSSPISNLVTSVSTPPVTNNLNEKSSDLDSSLNTATKSFNVEIPTTILYSKDLIETTTTDSTNNYLKEPLIATTQSYEAQTRSYLKSDPVTTVSQNQQPPSLPVDFSTYSETTTQIPKTIGNLIDSTSSAVKSNAEDFIVTIRKSYDNLKATTKKLSPHIVSSLVSDSVTTPKTNINDYRQSSDFDSLLYTVTEFLNVDTSSTISDQKQLKHAGATFTMSPPDKIDYPTLNTDNALNTVPRDYTETPFKGVSEISSLAQDLNNNFELSTNLPSFITNIPSTDTSHNSDSKMFSLKSLTDINNDLSVISNNNLNSIVTSGISTKSDTAFNKLRTTAKSTKSDISHPNFEASLTATTKNFEPPIGSSLESYSVTTTSTPTINIDYYNKPPSDLDRILNIMTKNYETQISSSPKSIFLVTDLTPTMNTNNYNQSLDSDSLPNEKTESYNVVTPRTIFNRTLISNAGTTVPISTLENLSTALDYINNLKDSTILQTFAVNDIGNDNRSQNNDPKPFTTKTSTDITNDPQTLASKNKPNKATETNIDKQSQKPVFGTVNDTLELSDHIGKYINPASISTNSVSVSKSPKTTFAFKLKIAQSNTSSKNTAVTTTSDISYQNLEKSVTAIAKNYEIQTDSSPKSNLITAPSTPIIDIKYYKQKSNSLLDTISEPVFDVFPIIEAVTDIPISDLDKNFDHQTLNSNTFNTGSKNSPIEDVSDALSSAAPYFNNNLISLAASYSENNSQSAVTEQTQISKPVLVTENSDFSYQSSNLNIQTDIIEENNNMPFSNIPASATIMYTSQMSATGVSESSILAKIDLPTDNIFNAAPIPYKANLPVNAKSSVPVTEKQPFAYKNIQATNTRNTLRSEPVTIESTSFLNKEKTIDNIKFIDNESQHISNTITSANITEKLNTDSLKFIENTTVESDDVLNLYKTNIKTHEYQISNVEFVKLPSTPYAVNVTSKPIKINITTGSTGSPPVVDIITATISDSTQINNSNKMESTATAVIKSGKDIGSFVPNPTLKIVPTTTVHINIGSNKENFLATPALDNVTPENVTTNTNKVTSTPHTREKPKNNPINVNNFVCTEEGNFIDPLAVDVYYRCLRNSSGFLRYKYKCGKGFYLDIKSVKCLPFEFNCTSEGRFLDDFNINVYYICIKQTIGPFIRLKYQCQSNYYLDATKVQCIAKQYHETQLPAPVTTEFKCPSEGRFADPIAGNTYYVCAKRTGDRIVRFKFKCQEGLLLDKVQVKCVVPKQTTKSYSLESKSSTSDEETTTTESNFNVFVCTEEGKFPMFGDCRRYYVCEERRSGFRRKRRKCENHKVYDKTRQRCVRSDKYSCDNEHD